MYQHLSESAKAVLKLAQKLAAAQHQEYVGTEHVLLGILEHGVGVGAQVLHDLAIDISQVEEQVYRLNRRSMEETWVLGRLPGTPHFKQVLALAIEEAEKVRDKKVGTEYLLLGLLREEGCMAEVALRNLGVTLNKARSRIAQQKGRPV